MFIVLLKFDVNKSKASQFMTEHNEWIQRGFDDGHFMLVGSIKFKLGGTIFAHNISRKDLEEKISTDPFIKENIVKAEIIEVEPGMVIQQLDFLVRDLAHE